ncbi:MAG: hypothetical protein K6B74_05680 [Ruminococcus sp.]|nr:hypothetical protein [Ruminococcus sp.]
MEDIYDRYKRMNFAELRKYLKDQRKIQKLYYALPAVLSVLKIFGYCMQGWSTYPSMVDEMSNNGTIHANLTTFGLFDWVVVLLLIPLLPFEKTHIKFDFASPILMTAYDVLKLLLVGAESFDPMLFGVTIYYILAALHLRVICKRIVFIKSLPDYPFSPAVELERQRELEVMKYSEQSQKNQKLIKQEEKKVAGTLEEKMSALPKRHIEELHISRGNFDDTEDDYTDKLIGEDLRDGAAAPEFEDTDKDYKEDFNTQDKLTIERRERIDEIDGGFEGDFEAESPKAYLFGGDSLDEAEKKVSLDKSQGQRYFGSGIHDSEDHDYRGDIPEMAAMTKADFDDSEEGYTDELFGGVKNPGIIDDEKPEGYKPVV